MLATCAWIFLSLILSFASSGCNKKGGSGQTVGSDGRLCKWDAAARAAGRNFLLRQQCSARTVSPDLFRFRQPEQFALLKTGKIQEIAAFLKEGSRQIIIAGFTDERGTAEYNRGLGDRRAGAVRESLISAGADGGRIQTVSFGAEMPADDGHSESAWAKNRRAEIGVVAR